MPQVNNEAAIARRRRYYLTHCEELKRYARQYRLKNHDRIQSIDHRHYMDNRDRSLAYHKTQSRNQMRSDAALLAFFDVPAVWNCRSTCSVCRPHRRRRERSQEARGYNEHLLLAETPRLSSRLSDSMHELSMDQESRES